MPFAERVRALRKERNMTQNDVANAMGVATRQYQRFESGEQKPGFDNLQKLADALQVSVDWLMGRTEKREMNR